MGGMQGFGPVHYDPDEPVFQEDWHRRVFGMGALAARLSGTNQPAFRHAIERVHPVQYLLDGYYGRWLDGALNLLIDSGVVAPGAVEARARKLAGEEDVTEPAESTPNKPHFQGENPQHVYAVAFDSSDVWGPDGEACTIHVDLYESYLEALS